MKQSLIIIIQHNLNWWSLNHRKKNDYKGLNQQLKNELNIFYMIKTYSETKSWTYIVIGTLLSKHLGLIPNWRCKLDFLYKT